MRCKNAEKYINSIAASIDSRMLPDIESKDGKLDLVLDALHQWVVLVGGTDNLELGTGIVEDNPHPTGSKDCSRSSSCLKLGLHIIHRTKRVINHLGQGIRWLGLLGLVRRRHFLPEEGMVVVTSTTVANWASIQSILHQVQDWLFIFSFHCLVDVGNIGSMMLVVVDFHGRGINVWLQGFVGVWQIWDEIRVGNGRGSKSSSGGQRLADDVSATGTGICVDWVVEERGSKKKWTSEQWDNETLKQQEGTRRQIDPTTLGLTACSSPTAAMIADVRLPIQRDDIQQRTFAGRPGGRGADHERRKVQLHGESCCLGECKATTEGVLMDMTSTDSVWHIGYKQQVDGSRTGWMQKI